MPYYKPKIGSIIRQAVPQDKKPLLALSEKQKEKLKSLGDFILAAAIVGTFPVSGIVMALIGHITNPAFSKRTFKRDFRSEPLKQKEIARKIAKTFHYMKKKGYIKLVPQGKDFLVKVRQKGRKKAYKLRFDTLEIKAGKNWDGHWWAVVADVPVEFRRRADLFREKIKDLGFYPLQRTVWVYPHDPRDEVDFVSAYYGIEHYVTAMRVDILDPEDEKALKGHFREKAVI